MRRSQTIIIIGFLLAFLVTSASSWVSTASAQSVPRQTVLPDYRLSVGDKLYMSVPQRPALSRQIVVEENGSVMLPLIGSVSAVGLTLPEFQARLQQSIQDLYPSISEVTLSVEELGAQAIYVTGMVGRPGRYSFDSKPTLWEAIREAGGPRPRAAMDAVQVVKSQEFGGNTITVDVQQALEAGRIDQLPLLDGGDTVVIPEEEQRYTGASGVNVIGAVTKPGIYKLQGRQDLMSAILLAGGPTRRAALEKVKVIQPQGNGTFVSYEVDLSAYLEAGQAAANPTLEAGYTVNVPEQNAVSYQFKNNVGIVLSVITSVLSITWLAIRIRDS